MTIVNKWIKEDAGDIEAYFSRHLAWMKLGQPWRAIDDLNKVINAGGNEIELMSRGEVYRNLGDHQKALDDFARAEALDPVEWDGHQVGLLFQADSHARLADEASALAYCVRLQDDFWTPGLNGAPAGNKAEIAERLKEIAAEARRQRR